jgi:hypothetical protein
MYQPAVPFVSATVFNLVNSFRNGISKNVLIVRGSAPETPEIFLGITRVFNEMGWTIAQR